MVSAERPSLDTIDGALDASRKSNVVAADIASIVHMKSRTATSFSTCSVATEEGVPESRDVAVCETRGGDGARDGACEGSNAKAITRERTSTTTSSSAPASPGRKTTDGSTSSPEPAVQTDDEGSGYFCSPLNLLTRAGNCIDNSIQDFYSTVELGTSAVFCASPEKGPLTADNLLSISADVSEAKAEALKRQPSLRAAKSEGTIQTQPTIKTQGTANNPRKVELEEGVEVQPESRSSCCLVSIFTCSDGDKDEVDKVDKVDYAAKVDNAAKVKADQVDQAVNKDKEVKDINQPRSSPRSLSDIIGDTLNINASQVDNLGSLSDEGTYESASQKSLDFVTPKAQNLLNEIQSLENNFHEVRKSASFSKEKMTELKKRQDPYIQKMATIKQTLLDQQALLQSAPEDTKQDFYRALSRAALLNAEVETRRAELELKKIRLESMRVEEEIDRMIGADGTFDDSFDESLTTMESERGMQQTFDVFARYTANKFQKMQRNKARKDKAAAE